MLGDKSYLNVRDGQKSAFTQQMQQSSKSSKFHQVLQEKEREIAKLNKAIKKLKKELKQKQEAVKLPTTTEGNNAYFKTMIERQVTRYNELKQLVQAVTQRIKKLSQEINSEFSIFQNSASMQNLVRMLETANISGSKEARSFSSQKSYSADDDEIYAQQAVDQFQIVVRGLMMKHGQTNKLYKQSLNIQKQIQQELKSCQKELKLEKKSKDLLQKLLQKNETQKNQLMNQINNIANKNEVQDLKSKSKQELILGYFKLHYRIQDLQKQKQQYIKSSTRDKQKQVKLYQALLSQVKNMKQRQRSRQSVA